MTTTRGPQRAAKRPGRRRRGRRVLVFVGAALAVVVAGALFADGEQPGAPAFSEGLASLGSADPVRVGQTFLVLMHTSPLPDVTVVSTEPRVLDDSAAAIVTVIVCDAATSLPGDGVQDLATACERARPVDGVDLGSLGPGHYLMMIVQPLEPGPITVDGADIAYTDGAHEQTQTVGVRVELP